MNKVPMNMTLVYRDPWDLRIEERPRPVPRTPRDVVVRVRATGICGTDIGIVRGAYQARPGVVIGHESAGEVAEVGAAVTTLAPGDRVVIDPTFHCGACPMCRSERPNHCEMKSVSEAGVSADGTFAHYFVTEDRFLHKIAAHVGFAEASLTEPLSCVLTGLNQLRLRPDMTTLVAGGGPMGALYSLALAARGFTGTLVEHAPERRKRLAHALPRGWIVAERLVPRPNSLDLVVDTTGTALSWALPALRRGGQVLMVGLTGEDTPVSPALLADRSLSIVGSIDSIGTFALANHMIATGVIPVRALISHVWPLERFDEAFAAVGLDLAARNRTAASINAVKVVLTS